MSEQEVEQEQEVDTNAEVRAVFDAEVGGDEDDVKLAMIGAGATFKNVARMYNAFMIDAGLALSKEDKATHVTEALEGLEFDTEESYDSAIIALVDAEKGINERSAGGLLRAYGKKNDLEVYTKPKSEGAGRTGFASVFYGMLAANPLITEADAKAYIENPENSENVRRHLSHYMGIWKLVNTIATQ